MKQRNDDAADIESRERGFLSFGADHFTNRHTTKASLDAIKREDLIAFYNRYFFPANVMLAVHGDFSAAEMKARIEKLFAGWTVKQPPVPPFPQVTAKTQPGIYLASKDDVTQTFFTIGHLGGTLRDKDYAALEVMGDILGGGFQSRLFQEITRLFKSGNQRKGFLL